MSAATLKVYLKDAARLLVVRKFGTTNALAVAGVFGESNEVFPPALIGGTTAEDIKTGIVAANAQGNVAQRTTMMKLARLSTMGTTLIAPCRGMRQSRSPPTKFTRWWLIS